MKIHSLLVAFAMVLNSFSVVEAANLIRTVDNFDILVDDSGSMMMSRKNTKIPKMEFAKKVLSKINKAIPNLGYTASMHTISPAKTLVPFGEWDMPTMHEAIQNLATNLPIFGRQSSFGNVARFVQGYSAMGRPTTIILVSDGLSTRDQNPASEAAFILNNQPGDCFHIISFADTQEGQDILEKIAGLNTCSVIVDGLELYTSQKAVDDFVSAVFYDDVIDDSFVISGADFAFDSTALSNETQGVLDDVATMLHANPNKIVLQGWSDSAGADAYHQVLSKRRADSVRTYLVKKGVPS